MAKKKGPGEGEPKAKAMAKGKAKAKAKSKAKGKAKSKSKAKTPKSKAQKATKKMKGPDLDEDGELPNVLQVSWMLTFTLTRRRMCWREESEDYLDPEDAGCRKRRTSRTPRTRKLRRKRWGKHVTLQTGLSSLVCECNLIRSRRTAATSTRGDDDERTFAVSGKSQEEVGKEKSGLGQDGHQQGCLRGMEILPLASEHNSLNVRGRAQEAQI